jgi:hypothetical protein
MGERKQGGGHNAHGNEKTSTGAGVIEKMFIFVSKSCLTLCTAPQNAEVRTVA